MPLAPAAQLFLSFAATHVGRSSCQDSIHAATCRGEQTLFLPHHSGSVNVYGHGEMTKDQVPMTKDGGLQRWGVRFLWSLALLTFVIFTFGRVAEWSNAPVLKTGVPQGTGGSNPSPTAESRQAGRATFDVGAARRKSVLPRPATPALPAWAMPRQDPWPCRWFLDSHAVMAYGLVGLCCPTITPTHEGPPEKHPCRPGGVPPGTDGTPHAEAFQTPAYIPKTRSIAEEEQKS
jgi:hypothetical protein